LPDLMYSHLLFDAVHQICRFLAGATSKHHLRLDRVVKDFRLPPSVMRPVLPMERHRVAQRHHLLAAATCLLLEWPERLQYYSGISKLSGSVLLKDMKNVPFFYQESSRT
jgi:hypothetical protein